MTTHPSADPPVTEFAGQLFFRLWRAHHARTAEALGSIDLTPPLFALLNVIGAREGAIQQELGSALGIDRSTMVSLLDQLESAGLAKRRLSATDRRAREIAITPRGRRLLQRARGLIAEVEDEVLAGLTATQRRELLGLLRRALDSAPGQPLWSSDEGTSMPNSKRNADKNSGSEPRLLSGGNPQIPKGEGDEPVQAYIAAMPGWKRSLGERLDGLIVRTVPDVHKAVKWNQPFYGHEGEGWFLAFRCYTKYVQLQFFRGTSLDPVPPKASKHDAVRYFDIHEHDALDEDQLVSWIEQASNLPGEKM